MKREIYIKKIVEYYKQFSYDEKELIPECPYYQYSFCEFCNEYYKTIKYYDYKHLRTKKHQKGFRAYLLEVKNREIKYYNELYIESKKL